MMMKMMMLMGILLNVMYLNKKILSFIVMILTKQEHLVVDGSCSESISSGGEFGCRPPGGEVHHQLGGVK